MSRINSIGIIILMILIAVGCSSSQEKSSADVQSSVPAMDFSGDYQFSSVVGDSNCVWTGLATGGSMESKITITQNGSTLKWSTFGVGGEVYKNQKSKISGNKSEFTKMNNLYYNSGLLWEATIEFSDTEFHGSGKYEVPTGTNKCRGIFTVTGERIK